ncbi:reprolysin-like metallopeptidase [Bergeyella sp. RCAD1439]|uniref:reprolysin-like metallopeptidase n=1 Tax=Bergeyella anatis TaxID=3113737 RepID=UPI002E18BE63|nr:zinc-dependent metalloprotease family protein [Bergeyella sp. RCAD1439]
MGYRWTIWFFLFLGSWFAAQWRPVLRAETMKPLEGEACYVLDVSAMKQLLSGASETGRKASGVEIQLPTLEGRLERFEVYSSPVVAPSLAAAYGLGSYVGRGKDDPEKYLRFSLSGDDFQSMIIRRGEYQFIEPLGKGQAVYGVFKKTGKTGLVCSVEENPVSRAQVERFWKANKSLSNQATEFSRLSDRKFRTLRLALSVTGEYTQYFGGVSQALIQMNATLTRVNGVLEKDLALRLVIQDFPELIYTDPSTDPYSEASKGASGVWSTELQNTLTATIGNAAYDIGHLFGASGGGGNSGCIGCVCEDNTVKDELNKGSGFTSPSDGRPLGATFDIDFVIHELGHQLGAYHTFSHTIESFSSNVEPGSGSTIMGYAGITNADVQPHSDPYFHSLSLSQIQSVLAAKSCAGEKLVSNYPPVISPLAAYTIPKSTPFVLTATATDVEGDPLTYVWEQVDAATFRNTSVTGTNVDGALFRSWLPVAEAERYFPKLSSVMQGRLTVPEDWETVSHVARPMHFRVTVRDNHPLADEQQTSYETQTITVGGDGPFKINLSEGANFYAGQSNALAWEVANTVGAPYRVANVRVSYTVDGGGHWTVLLDEVPNNGLASVVLPQALLGTSSLQFRVEALGNVFYAVSPKVNVVDGNACLASVPSGLQVSGISYDSAVVSWGALAGVRGYVLEYRREGDALYTPIEGSIASVTLYGLESGARYEVRVKSICPLQESAYSEGVWFTTLASRGCVSSSTSGVSEYIGRVELGRFSVSSGASEYTDFSTTPYRYMHLNKGESLHSLRVTPKWAVEVMPVSVSAWVDFNGDGVWTSDEKIMAAVSNGEAVVSAFSVPEGALVGEQGVKMRVALRSGTEEAPVCGVFDFGEVEDYLVVISDQVPYYGAGMVAYPNPFYDEINVSNVPDGTGYRLYDASGRLVASGTVILGKLDFGFLIPGVYLLAVEGRGTLKIMKEH